jgi:hypothetical protein
MSEGGGGSTTSKVSRVPKRQYVCCRCSVLTPVLSPSEGDPAQLSRWGWKTDGRGNPICSTCQLRQRPPDRELRTRLQKRTRVVEPRLSAR